METFRVFPHLEVSDLGRIRLFGRILPQRSTKKGYIRHKIAFEAQRFIAFTFLGPPPGEDYVVDHRDRNPANNQLSNLRWVTRRENLENSQTADAWKRARSAAQQEIRHARRRRRFCRPYLVESKTEGRYYLYVRSNGVRHRLGAATTHEKAEAMLAVAQDLQQGGDPDAYAGQAKLRRVARRMAEVLLVS